jgi:hypothetical protein
MALQRTFLVILLLISSVTLAFAQEEASMPFTLFKKYISETDTPDPKYFHPILKDARRPVVFASIQEGNLLRVGDYGGGGEGERRDLVSISHYINDTGVDLSGLPAGYLSRDDHTLKNLFFGENGEYELAPYAPPKSKKIGTSEWPNNMTWRHVWKNYYIITVYRGTKVAMDHLTVERDGKDVYPILGDSNENPPDGPGFSAAWLGNEVFITPNDWSGSFSMIVLDNESPLPEDFPKDLIKWIP